MSQPKTGTVALVVRFSGRSPLLVEQISDDQEIQFLEESLRAGRGVVLEELLAFREGVERESEQFGDYVEALITRPFVPREVLEHGLQWLRSKIKIEEFKRHEREATQVIAEYAFQIFERNLEMNEFLLAGPSAQVRIRVFTLSGDSRGGMTPSGGCAGAQGRGAA